MKTITYESTLEVFTDKTNGDGHYTVGFLKLNKEVVLLDRALLKQYEEALLLAQAALMELSNAAFHNGEPSELWAPGGIPEKAIAALRPVCNQLQSNEPRRKP